MLLLYRMMQTMRLRSPSQGAGGSSRFGMSMGQQQQQQERIVVVSNYTQTLDLIQQMCVQNNWPVLRLDGSISANKRTQVVDEFNNPGSGAFAFLLSSKAGGCGINLIGGSR
jgi:DNA repair and recombination protein RAD54 and RAD54-like protein